jgi:hypothetical protein
MNRYEWPTREEWARDRRAPYIDRFDDVPVSNRASDYATADEIEAEVARLREHWKRLGRVLRSAPTQEARWQAQDQRRRHNRAIALLREDTVPVLATDGGGLVPELTARYERARLAAMDRRRHEIAGTPIDDAAWAAELERRAALDALGAT